MTFSTHRELFALSLLLFASIGPTNAQDSPSDVAAPNPSVLLLAEDSVASELKLDDETRQKIRLLLQQRANESSEDPTDEPQRLGEIDQQIIDLLSVEQKTQFAKIAAIPRISFSYREAKWVDVLTWFAKQSGLSLLVNDPPPDTFTYSDTRKYTPREAIDLLNGVLVTKGYTLVRKDRLLICLRVADGIPDGVIPETTVEELNEFGSFELVKVVFPLGGRVATTVETEIKPLLGSFGTTAFLPQSNRLIVTSNAGNMRAIAAAIDSIDPPKAAPTPKKTTPPAPELITYDTLPADATMVAAVLSKVIGEDAKLTINASANQITAYSVPSEHALIKKVLTQLQQNVDSADKPILEIYPFHGEGFATLTEQAALAAKDATITLDQANRRILVFATPQTQKTVVSLMEKLDGQTVGSAAQANAVNVFTLENAETSSVAEALQILFPNTRITSEPAVKRIVVRASELDRRQIEELIKKLDQEPERSSIRFIQLEKKLEKDQVDALKVVAPEADVRFQEQGKRLMVIAKMSDHLAIETLLAQFRGFEPSDDRPLRLYELSSEEGRLFQDLHRKMDKSLESIEIIRRTNEGEFAILATPQQHEAIDQLIADLKPFASQPKKQIQTYSVDDDLKRRFMEMRSKLDPSLSKIEIINQNERGQIVILATDEQHVKVESLLAELRIKLAPQLRELKTYDVRSDIRRRFDQTRSSLSPSLKTITIVDAGRDDKLAVVATADQHAKVEAFLSQLTLAFPEEPKSQLRLYSVTAAEKRQFVAALPTLQKSIGEEISVVDSQQADELLLSATDQTHKKIASALSDLRSQSAALKRQFVGYPVEKGDVQSIQTLLAELYSDARIVADFKSEQLLVWADSEQQEQIKVAVEQMDVEPSSRKRNKMAYYRMGDLDARDLRSMFQQLVPDMTILTDRKTNSLIAWGSDNDHQTLAKSVKEFREQSEKERRTVTIYKCGTRDPIDVRSLLNELVPSATVVQDRETGVVMVWATESDHQEIAMIVEQVKGRDDENASIKSYGTPEIDADSVIGLLDELVPNARLFAAAGDTQIIAFADDAEHEKIASTVREMNAQSKSNGSRVFQTYNVEPTTASQIVDVLATSIPKAQVSLSDDQRIITVWASAEEQQLAIEAISSVAKVREQSDQANRRVAVSYPCGTRDPLDVRTLLRQAFPDVTVQHDRDTGVVMVWATADEQAQVKEIVDQVRGSDTSDAVVRVYSTLEMDADAVIALLNDLVPNARFLDAANDTKVVAFANEKDHAAVDSLIREMSADDPNQAQRVLQTYRLSAGISSQVRNVLEAAIPKAVISFADDDRSMTVFGSPKDQELAQATVESASNAGRQDDGANVVVKAYPSPRIDADYVISILSEMLPDANFYDAAGDTQVVAVADESLHARIATLVSEMNSKGETDGNYELQTFEILPEISSQIQDILSNAVPNATLAFSNDERTLTIWADRKDQGIVTELVSSSMEAKLKSDERLAGDVRVYPLGADINADDIANSLPADLISPDSVRSATDRNALIIRASVEKHRHLKRAIDDIVKTLPQPERPTTEVYRLKKATPSTAIAPLSSLFPTASFAYNDNLSNLIVTALPRQQEVIQSVVTKMDVEKVDDRDTKIYRFQQASPDAAVSPLSTLIPSATFAVDAATSTIIVTATAEQHETIAKVVSDLDRPPTNKLITEVFPLVRSTPAAAQAPLARLLPSATIAIDNETNSLIATATQDEIDRIDGVVKSLEATTPRLQETRVYQLKTADPGAAERVLNQLLPRATFAVDGATGTILATALPSDHETIDSTLTQFDKPTSRTAQVQAYAVLRADVNSAFETLTQIYRDHPVVRLSVDRQNKSIIARAPPAEQQTIASIVARLESGNGGSDELSLEVYPLDTFDATNTISGLDALFRNETSKPEFQYDSFVGQMFVVATAEQHRRVADSLSRLAGEPTDVEVFQLRAVDSFSVEQAIDRLYSGANNGPVVSSDPDTQQLLVRGTKDELDAIRLLLGKMGEVGLGTEDAKSSSRVIPFRGNVDAAVRQLQDVWPQLRTNQLNILKSNEIEAVDALDNEPDEIEINESEAPANSPEAPTGSAAPNNRDADGQDARRRDRKQSATTTHSVSVSQEPKNGDSNVAPVFVIPGASSITVSSDDPDALRQAESLLRAISQQAGAGSSAGNFAVFRLRNAGARSVAQLLTKLFEQMPETTRGSLGRVSLVADDRMNAIVVHGRPTDRNVLGQLLNVLDTDNADDSLANAVPDIVPVKHTNADRILNILQTVYQSQLERGGQTEEVDIPEGIDTEVASVLRQINAATAGPLLTLEVDMVTNSIIVLAPKLLGEQVAKVIGRLDKAAETDDSRAVKIIPLTGVKSEILREAIDQFLNR